MNTHTAKRIGKVGDEVVVYGDMSRAESSIYVVIPDYGFRAVCTPYQTADARHSKTAAVRLAREWMRSQGTIGIDLSIDVHEIIPRG
jgi:hypothetical protein